MEKVMDWLEPSINKRIDYVTECCDKSIESIDIEFNEIIKSMRKRYPACSADLLTIESLFIQRITMVDTAYRIGLKDGIALFRSS